MPKRRSKQELLEIVQDKSRACIDRGEAIGELVEAGMSQVDIAESTRPRLSTAAVSHLKTCFHNLEGAAREMCRGRKMNADACYSLASASGNRERIFQCAVKIRELKDAQRAVQRMGSKGKQTPRGQITDEDLKEAIQNVQHELARNTLVGRPARTEFHKTLVRRRTSTEAPELKERDDVPREILAELKSERLKAQQEAEEDKQEYYHQVRKDEEGRVRLRRRERNGRSPRSCLEDKPTAFSTHFAGAYIDVAAIALASGLGVNRISRVFSGESMLSLDVARRVSAALGMGLGDFIDAMDRQTALQQGLRKRGLTDAEIGYTIAEGWKRGFKPPDL